MVLVAYIPDNSVSILQTKFRNREGHEARRIGLEAMPLDQHIEGRHGERQARLKIRPAPMHHLLQMADERQHGEHGLHQHALLPFPPLTQFEVARITLRSMEARIAQNNHALLTLPNQPLKRIIRSIGGGTRPRHHQPYWFSSRQSLPPTIHRWWDRPLRPICWGLRPSRIGWMSSIP